MCESFDATNSGHILFEEFKQDFSNYQFSKKYLLDVFNSALSLAMHAEFYHVECTMLCRFNLNYLHFILHMQDIFGDGHINYAEFLVAAKESLGKIVDNERLLEVFQYLDRDESRFIMYYFSYYNLIFK